MFRIALLLIFIVCKPFCVSAQLNAGLVAHWNFSGNANDVSGNSHNGTANNITYTNGKSGLANTAASFNGVNAFINVPHQNDLNVNAYTICAVVKPMGFYQGTCQGNFIMFRGSEGSAGAYGIGYFDNAYNDCTVRDTNFHVFYAQAGSSSGNVAGFQSATRVHTNNWYCLCATYDGSTIKIYVNSVLSATYVITSGTIGSSSTPIGIGRYLNGGGAFPYWYNGLIDDLRLYNRVLSQVEIDSFCNLFPTGVVPEPEVSIAQPVNPTAFCPAASFVLHYTVTLPFNTGNIFSVQLSDAAGSFATPVVIGSVAATGAGTINCTIPANTPPGSGYRVRVVASNPVKTSANNGVNLTVYSAAQLNLYGDTAVCLGDTLKLNAQVTPAGTLVQWQGPNGFSDTGLSVVIPGAAYNDSGMYIATANYNGCTASDTIIAIVGDVDFDLGNDTLICSGVQIKLYTGVKGATHLWQDGSTTDTFIVRGSGTHFVTASLGSCQHSDTVTIAIQQVLLQLPADSVLCPNGSVQLSVTDTFDTYLWSTMNTGPSIPIDKAGLYWLRVSKGKCFASDSTYIKMLEPYFLLGNDTTICNGRTLVLRANSIEGSDYTWQNGSKNQTFTVKEKGFYYVTAQNICGTFQSNINVDYYQCECYPIMPTAFTPNGDGLNDDIGPMMDCTPKEFKYMIANRWGEVVFETDEFGKRWDGKHFRVPAALSTYYYWIQITDVLGNTTMHKGDILLLR